MKPIERFRVYQTMTELGLKLIFRNIFDKNYRIQIGTVFIIILYIFMFINYYHTLEIYNFDKTKCVFTLAYFAGVIQVI